VAEWTRARAEALAPVVERIEALIRASRVRCLDETGLRIGGETQWLHTAAAPTLTLYRACDKRGEMPEGLEGGVVVHDGFKPYRNLDGAGWSPAHALCNAHHLRELKALVEFDKRALGGEDARLSSRRLPGGRGSPRQRSRPPRCKPSTPATGRRCAGAWPSIAACLA
jgi:hypothetical protein